MFIVKIIKNILIVVFSLILFLIIAGVLVFIFSKFKNIYIYNQVKSISGEEISKIVLDNEIKEAREDKFMGSGCSYDYKVRSTRCPTSYSMYFVSDNSLIDEFQKVDKYLQDLGWKPSYVKDKTLEELEKKVSKGLAPSQIYYKKVIYNLDLYLTFYQQKDRQCEFGCSDKVKKLLEKYQTPNNSVYSIILYTDMVDR